LQFQGVEHLSILKGIKLNAAENCAIQIVTGKPSRSDDDFRVPAEIRQQTAGDAVILHSRANIILSSRRPSPPAVIAATFGRPYSQTVAAAYTSLLFHAPALQGIRHVDSIGPEVITARVSVSPPPAQWLSQPLRGNWLAEPLLLDASFQLMVLWCWENCNM